MKELLWLAPQYITQQLGQVCFSSLGEKEGRQA